MIRDAIPADATAIARIYNQGIEERMATLETEPRSAEERASWLAARGPRHPVMVAEENGEVAGWASLNLFNPREAYRHVADFSVYVDRAHRGKGIGDRLMSALADRASALGYHKLVMHGFPENNASTKLYARQGFREVGIYREQGMVDGIWRDIVIMEKLLQGEAA